MAKFKEVNAHTMVANLCEEMAQSIYEECASKYNAWYAMHPDRREFVRECAPTLREHARGTLAEMMNRNGLSIQEKDQIYEALILDATIPRGGEWEIPNKRFDYTKF